MKTQIEKMLKENGIKYFSGKNETQNILTFPFVGIKDENNHVFVYMELDKKNKMVTFRIAEDVNKDKDINVLRTELLDLNSRLNVGSLSMSSDSDIVEYKIDLIVGEAELDYKLFLRHIIYCVHLYEKLKEDALIA